MKMPKWVPQSPRPLMHGDDWDKLTPEERQTDFVLDIILGIGGTIVVYNIAKLFS